MDTIEMLKDEIYYHGLLPREDVKDFLKKDGDFLVRMTEPSEPGKREFVLSVFYDKHARPPTKHIVINCIGGKYTVEKQLFDTVPLLISHLLKTQSFVSTKSGQVLLRNPIGRSSWELEHKDIKRTKLLGNGAFGEVYLGELNKRRKSSSGKHRIEKIAVAVKVTRLDAMKKEDIKDMMREARIMRFFDHPHIIRLYGVAAIQEPLMLVMELAIDGALNCFLQKNAPVELKIKMEMILQAAWGLEHFHNSQCLHRDIAARNFLYGNRKVKLSDFGMSRVGTVYHDNQDLKCAIRWLAPETMRNFLFTQKTDVFSYGIFCWEVLHDAKQPYPELSMEEVLFKVRDGGYRMHMDDLPEFPAELIELIKTRVLAENPNDRYRMNEIARHLERITKTPQLQLKKEASKPPSISSTA